MWVGFPFFPHIPAIISQMWVGFHFSLPHPLKLAKCGLDMPFFLHSNRALMLLNIWVRFSNANDKSNLMDNWAVAESRFSKFEPISARSWVHGEDVPGRESDRGRATTLQSTIRSEWRRTGEWRNGVKWIVKEDPYFEAKQLWNRSDYWFCPFCMPSRRYNKM